MKPSTDVELAGDDAARMQKLIDALESLDDVQEVYTNAVLRRVAQRGGTRARAPTGPPRAGFSASIPGCG